MQILIIITELFCSNQLTNFITEVLKILIPTIIALIVLKKQLKRNREIQAEGTFFNLLSSIRNLVLNTDGNVNSIVIGTYTNKIEKHNSGISYFYQANKELQSRLWTALGKGVLDGVLNTNTDSQLNAKAINEVAIETYNIFFKDHLPELSHYFRFIYNVLNFVHSHKDIPRAKKIDYINFVQSQMSDSELQLLFYNGIGLHGKKSHTLIEKYNFLQNMSTGSNKAIFEQLYKLYPKSSFRL